MNSETLDLFSCLLKTCSGESWKKDLDTLFLILRKKFVFDNLNISVLDLKGNVPEVIYARAAGRGRNKEAESSWGGEMANQVIANGRIIESIPEDQNSSDRMTMPYCLGLPLAITDRKGALVFIRFGGPRFTDEEMPAAALAAIQVERSLELNTLHENLFQLEHARHLAQLQDDFIATISHELHTPLGFIKGYTTSLLRSDTIWDPSTQMEFLNIIDEESDHLLTLIDHMLDSARLQSGNMAMDFQPVRLDSLLRDVVTRVKGRFNDLDVRLNLPPVPHIQADSVRITQVIDNLFENAIKYAPGSRITISLQAKEDWQIILFSDVGPGIPHEHIPFLFERFYRVPCEHGKSGTGLGLFICKQIIQAHHGLISIKTAPGHGTSFRVELPVHLERIIKEV